MEFNKGFFQSAIEYSLHAFACVMPGLILLELIYDRGLFSGGVDSLYSMVLLLLWAFAFSLPYHMLIGWFADIKELLPKNQRRVHLMTILQLPLFMILPIITYAIYGALGTVHWLSSLPLTTMQTIHLRFLLSLLGTTFVAPPLGWIFVRWLKEMRIGIASMGEEGRPPEEN